MCAQLLGQRSLVLSAGNGHRAEATLDRELHAQVSQPSDPQDGHQVARLRTAVPEAVVGGYARAHQRRRIRVLKIIRNQSQRICWSYRIVGIAAIEGDAGNLSIGAQDKVAPAAGRAVITMAAVPAEADTLAGLEQRHVGRYSIKDAGDFVAGNAGIIDPGKDPEFGDGIAMADATGLHPDAHLTGAGIGKLLLYQRKGAAGCGNLYGTSTDFRHKYPLSCCLG